MNHATPSSEVFDRNLRATTTHAAPGEGHPRLLFAVGADFHDGDSPRVFELASEVTRIGSSSDCELRMPGLLPLHAQIRHDLRDEYVLFTIGDAQLSITSDEDGKCTGHTLRSGWRVDLGPWAMSFQRDEFADHGRPFGGRQGGEFEHQQRQAVRASDRGQRAAR